MTESKRSTFDYMKERFFKQEVTAGNYKEILKEKLTSLKNLDDDTINSLKEMKIEKIKDIIKADIDEIKDKFKSTDFPQQEVDSAIIVFKLLQKFLSPKTKEDFKKTGKVAVMGMQNAGKTSFINFLIGEKPDEKFKETEPTVSVANRDFKLNDVNLAIWDFGGQESFRKEYLANPDEFFINTEVLLYIVDAQDEKNYADSIQYLMSILSILEKMDVNVSIILDFHKYDPDLIHDIDFMVKLQWLEEKFESVLQTYKFSYEFMRSSIFNDIANPNEPELAKNLKDIFSKKAEDIGQQSEIDMLKNILYVQTKIYMNMVTNFLELKNAINNLKFAPPGTSGSIQSAPAREDLKPTPEKEEIPMPKRVGPSSASEFSASIVNELKEIFRKKRMKTP